MKYLFVIFLLCAAGLAAQVYLGDPPANPFADGHLACLPMPPPVKAVAAPMLPPPKLDVLALPMMPQPIQVSAKIEIFDPQAGTGRMQETRMEDRADWGFSQVSKNEPIQLASAMQPRLVRPVPVTPVSIAQSAKNSPMPETSSPLDGVSPGQIVEDAMAYVPSNLKSTGEITSQSDTLAASVAQNNPITLPDTLQTTSPIGVPSVVQTPQTQIASVPPPSVSPTAPPVPEPPVDVTPNLYLPEGARDEEGALLTLIKPELNAYELPDAQSSKASFVLKAGDKVRPLMRLRNDKDFDWIKIEHGGATWWVTAEYFIRVDPRNKLKNQMTNLPVGEEQVDRDSALSPDYKPSDLTPLNSRYAFGPKEILLRKEAAEAFERMAAEAEKQGIKIRAFSGYRGFDHQKKLYMDAVEKNGPKQNGTAAPGYSEHQLGTTTDICNPDPHTVLSGKFGETPAGRWLTENSEKFGFRKSYTNENTDEMGYKPEPWHFRYVGVNPTASPADIARK
jgi:LAS superfamily LD-carboxypeptidase LdcB